MLGPCILEGEIAPRLTNHTVRLDLRHRCVSVSVPALATSAGEVLESYRLQYSVGSSLDSIGGAAAVDRNGALNHQLFSIPDSNIRVARPLQNMPPSANKPVARTWLERGGTCSVFAR